MKLAAVETPVLASQVFFSGRKARVLARRRGGERGFAGERQTRFVSSVRRGERERQPEDISRSREIFHRRVFP